MNNNLYLGKYDNKINLGPSSLGNSVFSTLQTKIDPLFTTQEKISENISDYLTGQTIFKDTSNYINNSLLPLYKPIQSLNDNLNTIDVMVNKLNLLSEMPSYDFVRKPILSLINSATDSINIGQKQILSFIPEYENDLSNLKYLYTPTTINQISSLGSMALNYLDYSTNNFSTDITFAEPKINILEKKVDNLEFKIEKLEEKERNIELTNITKDVSLRLKKLNPNLSNCFSGAMTTLIEGKSEDLVGQVAESLTRVIEELPFLLTNKQKFSSVKKEDKIKEAMEDYLGLKDGEIDSHHLFLQQQGYYTVLSNTRHRNEKVYIKYNQNKKLFKALVIQIEAYIYIMITYGDKN